MIDKFSEITNQTLLISGIVFIIIGCILYKFPPKQMNIFYGYRTRSSMENQTKWDLAQKYSGKIMISFGLGMFILSFYRIFINTSNLFDVIIGYVLNFLSVGFMFIVVEKKINS